MSLPVVSIIITTKNSSSTLEALLKSIKNQNYKKIEIILVDNHSIDRTVDVAKKYTKKVYLLGPERSAQRNFGAKKAQGKYLLFLDSDMELTPSILEQCIRLIKSKNIKAIILPEKTVGEGIIQKVRKFEREMYEGDASIELARFYDKKVFSEFGGFDENLTGPEDYDLFYRVSKKYIFGRVTAYVLHHEEGLTLKMLLGKKYYYASKGAIYADKHPELIRSQGNILFRKMYLRHWKKFLHEPLIGCLFICTRILETTWAVAGYIHTVGILNFVRNLPKLIRI